MNFTRKKTAGLWNKRLHSSCLGVAFGMLSSMASAQDAAVEIGPDGSAFWDVPATVEDGMERGDIYWIQQRDDAPDGSNGWNIIYVSEDVQGDLVYVSGQIFVPDAAADEPRPLALWNHQTVGMQDSCAPSRNNLFRANGTERIPSLTELLERGYVVVGSDYQGLGTPGGSAYLNGPAQAVASLDAARAALKFPDANADSRFATYGWSQGGQTSLWAAHLQEEYAPELDLLGAMGIAPASRHWDLTEYDLTTTITGGYYIQRMVGLKVGRPELNLRDVLSVEGLEMLGNLPHGCWDIAAATEGTVTTTFANLQGLEPGQPWREVLDANDAFLPVKAVPHIFFQGDLDTAVPASLTLKVAQDLCRQGVPVEYHDAEDRDHGTIVAVAAEAIPDWFDARFAGDEPVDHCDAVLSRDPAGVGVH